MRFTTLVYRYILFIIDLPFDYRLDSITMSHSLECRPSTAVQHNFLMLLLTQSSISCLVFLDITDGELGQAVLRIYGYQ